MSKEEEEKYVEKIMSKFKKEPNDTVWVLPHRTGENTTMIIVTDQFLNTGQIINHTTDYI